METKTETKTTAPAVAKKTRVVKTPTTKVKAAPKTKPVVEAAEKVKKAPAPKVNVHSEAGVDTSLYAGMSSYLNANRKTRINTSLAQFDPVDLTDRQKKLLYAARSTYGEKPFQARGMDNGILAALVASGVVSASGGIRQEEAGKMYLYDAEKPVMLKVTAKGAAYGKA